MKILFTGGGSAGHIFPIIAIVKEIKRNHPQGNFRFFYIGPRDDFAFSLLSKEGIAVKTILAGKIRRYFSLLNIADIIFKFPIGIIQSFFHIFIISPDLIFSKGGYGSLPVVIAGWTLFTPIFIHESDSSVGLSNKIAGKFALRVFASFSFDKDEKNFPLEKVFLTGNPIRKEIIDKTCKNPGEFLNLKKGKPLLLILGGSQGAQKINEQILLVLEQLLKNFEIIHQTGRKNFSAVKKEAEAIIESRDLINFYHPHSFLNEMELSCAYQAADLVISRAGSGSIFEIAASGKPSILVPLSNSAQSHQVKNGYLYAQKGAAIIMEETNFTSGFLLERLKQLFSEPEKLKKMSKKAQEFAKPDAAKIIADYIVRYFQGQA